MKTLKHKNIKTNFYSRVLMLSCFNEKCGFTLIELLITIGITFVLAAVAVPIYGNLQVSAQLNENAAQIVQTARIARERSAARLNNASHGLYLEINPGADRFILYQGNSYDSRDISYDRAVTLDNALSLTTTLTGNEVNFSKGLGAPNATGTITLTHTAQGSRGIVINDMGMVEEQ